MVILQGGGGHFQNVDWLSIVRGGGGDFQNRKC